MKSLLTLLLSSILCVTAYAQTDQRLEQFLAMFSDSNVLMDISYTVTLKNAPAVLNQGTLKGNASLSIQGNMYAMDGSGLVIKCDGTSVQIEDTSAKEVIYEPVCNDVRDGGYLMNPTMLFNKLDDVFRLDRVTSDNLSDIYLLVSREQCGIENCRLDFNMTSGKLTYAEFLMSDGNVVKVNVSSFKVASPAPESEITLKLPSAYGADWVVTDLR